MKKIGAVIGKITDITVVISFVCVAAMILLNVADVVGNKIFNTSIPGAYEITEILLMCAVFAAFAYGQKQKTHIHMTLLIDKLPDVGKFIIFSLLSLLSTVIAGIVTYATYKQAVNILSRGAASGILKIPYYPFYYLAFACMIVFTINLLYDAVIAVLAIFKKEYREAASGWW